ncbi:MAG: SpoIIE family protein phosphatase [bacterium]|nr:SpoIIE family protein phosphatase [bacterium]
MFNTIKSKIIFIVVSILLVLSLVLSFFAYINFKNEKGLMLSAYDYNISTFAEKINREIENLNDNAIGLALLGESYYQTGKNRDLFEKIIKEDFEYYQNSISGGIWFEPYVINPTQMLSRLFVYYDDDNNVLIDRESDSLNYFTECWYIKIKEKLSDKILVAWSPPYIDNRGSKALMTTVGAGIYNQKNELVGISTVDWEISSIFDKISKMPPTKNSFALFADKGNDYILVSTDKNLTNDEILGGSLKLIPWYSESLKNMDNFEYHGVKFVSYIKTLANGMILIINVPEKELFEQITKHMALMLFSLLMTSILVAILIYVLLKENINRPIDELTRMANKIGQGDLDTEIKLEEPKEFADLAETFNKMTKDIKHYINNINSITKEKEKIESELSIARTIQYSVLPHTFYPNMDEFDIFATMDTAKEVGGDFYDFFFINPTQFMFLIADVSGKGIPAALFMMTTKTLIKNFANENYSPKELIEKINNQICENNTQGFFVTMFASIVDVETGKITYINCGHNPPLIKHADGKYEYLKIFPNLVLGAMNGARYEISESVFNVGDTIFLYTDGVTEAMNETGELYGEERLLECLNNNCNEDAKQILRSVKRDVDNYIGKVEPSDDITMLTFRYNGAEDIFSKGKVFVSQAKVENYSNFVEWLQNTCKELNVAQSVLMKLELISEELFLNVANYAYPDGFGNLEIYFGKQSNHIILKFVDSGIPYNPLEKDPPDITLDANSRPIGGLGIYMVQQTADDISYQRENDKNILTVCVSLN